MALFENDIRTSYDDRAAALFEELLAMADEGTRVKLLELDDALINAEQRRMVRAYDSGYRDGRQAATAKKRQQSFMAKQAAWNLI